MWGRSFEFCLHGILETGFSELQLWCGLYNTALLEVHRHGNTLAVVRHAGYEVDILKWQSFLEEWNGIMVQEKWRFV